MPDNKREKLLSLRDKLPNLGITEENVDAFLTSPIALEGVYNSIIEASPQFKRKYSKEQFVGAYIEKKKNYQSQRRLHLPFQSLWLRVRLCLAKKNLSL